MEVVLGIGEEVRPNACSSEIEQGSGEKILKDDTDVAQENGVRVSVNGVENLNDSGVIEDCMMNGVSSLLKLNQITENIPEDEEDEDEDDEESEEEEEEEEHGYHVGDFVWGKIKNHPWWPGQIYDPSDASELALKMKQKGKLLVAYFGDGTFAWCGPSQLKPFAEGFEECSKMSNSRSFLGAVEESVEELGRHIERLLICDCAEEKHKFDNPEAKNAGIKEGVFVRDARREMISSLLVGQPGGILEDVKGFAETVSFSGLLELEILKRKVSAFYRSKRGFGLPEYHEPQSVPGLEDKNNDDDDDDDGSKQRRGGAKRSSKDDKEVEEKAGLDLEVSLKVSLEKCSSGFPDHRLIHRRKQKSIAEILENESAAKVRFEMEPEDGDVKLSKKKLKRCDEVKGELATVTASTPRTRKMREVSTIEDGSHNQVEETSKGKRKGKKIDINDNGNVDTEEKNEVSDSEMDIDSAPLASLRRKVKVDASSVEKTAGNGETATQTSSKRERKKSKYFSPDYLSDFSSKWRNKSKIKSESSKVSTQSQVGEEMTDASDRLLPMEEDKLDKPCEPSLANGVDHQELSEELINAVDFLRLGATPMEMRDLIRVAALGTEYPEDSSSRDMVREFMSIYRSFTYHEGANSKFLGTCDGSDKGKDELNENGETETKGKERKDKKRKAKQQIEEIEQIGKEENETDKHGTKPKKSKPKKQGVEEEKETLKEASEPTKKEQKRKESEKSKKQEDKEERETLKESSESTKKERKRKKPESKKQGEGEEEILKGSSESSKEERKPKKPKEPVKKKEREGKSKKKDTEKEFAGAELFVTFGSGSSLPKKEDLIEVYEKFGVLEEERTDMLYNNSSGRVAFMNIADGEKAFESSQEKCPFASPSTVKFRLKYPNEKKAEAEVAETKLEMEYVKKKLEEMRSLINECEEGMSKEVKVKLEDEMRNLLEKVRKMSFVVG